MFWAKYLATNSDGLTLTSAPGSEVPSLDESRRPSSLFCSFLKASKARNRNGWVSCSSPPGRGIVWGLLLEGQAASLPKRSAAKRFLFATSSRKRRSKNLVTSSLISRWKNKMFSDHPNFKKCIIFYKPYKACCWFWRFILLLKWEHKNMNI